MQRLEAGTAVGVRIGMVGQTWLLVQHEVSYIQDSTFGIVELLVW
jgi:hypothetical protein